jgi:hypothetical protein
MKQKVDAFIAKDDKFEQFIIWFSKKFSSVQLPENIQYNECDYFTKLNCIRYESLNPSILDHAIAVENYLSDFERPVLALGEVFHHIVEICSYRNIVLESDLTLERDLSLDLILDIPLSCKFESKLKEVFSKLQENLPDPIQDRDTFKKWWKVNGQVWNKQLIDAIIEHRNISQNWYFSEEDKNLLNQYYYANKLLMDCINRASIVSAVVRQEIKDTRLLPIAEIENRRGTGANF